ncbi:hypothetical protein ACVW0A_003834 [Pseudomonas sp. TE3610]
MQATRFQGSGCCKTDSVAAAARLRGPWASLNIFRVHTGQRSLAAAATGAGVSLSTAWPASRPRPAPTTDGVGADFSRDADDAVSRQRLLQDRLCSRCRQAARALGLAEYFQASHWPAQPGGSGYRTASSASRPRPAPTTQGVGADFSRDAGDALSRQLAAQRAADDPGHQHFPLTAFVRSPIGLFAIVRMAHHDARHLAALHTQVQGE